MNDQKNVCLLFQWMAEVNQIVIDDPALAPLLQTFPIPYPQDSPELIDVNKLICWDEEPIL